MPEMRLFNVQRFCGWNPAYCCLCLHTAQGTGWKACPTAVCGLRFAVCHPGDCFVAVLLAMTTTTLSLRAKRSNLLTIQGTGWKARPTAVYRLRSAVCSGIAAWDNLQNILATEQLCYNQPYGNARISSRADAPPRRVDGLDFLGWYEFGVMDDGAAGRSPLLGLAFLGLSAFFCPKHFLGELDGPANSIAPERRRDHF